MFKYEESVEANCNIEKAYELVSDVESYPRFIPWCSKVELISSDAEYTYYKVVAKFGMFTQEFTTKNKFYKNEKIEVNLDTGPFKKLYSSWEFKDLGNNKTQISFYIEFEFKSIMLTKLLGKIFLDANKKILTSFLRQLDIQ